jgi:hypothetical protein
MGVGTDSPAQPTETVMSKCFWCGFFSAIVLGISAFILGMSFSHEVYLVKEGRAVTFQVDGSILEFKP